MRVLIWFRDTSIAVILSTMKKITLATLLILSCATAWAADFYKGLAAYYAGDSATALAEWKSLAEQGDVGAQTGLGFVYSVGRGVIQDNVYAHMWWNLAAAEGDEDAKSYKDDLVKQMTPQDISKAQDLARECVKKSYKDC